MPTKLLLAHQPYPDYQTFHRLCCTIRIISLLIVPMVSDYAFLIKICQNIFLPKGQIISEAIILVLNPSKKGGENFSPT